MSGELEPVSTRLVSPPTYRPSHPLIAEWRPVTVDDLDVVLSLMRAMDRVDHPNFLSTREEIDEIFGLSFVDLEADTLIAYSSDGEPVAVGVAVLPPIQETLVRSFLHGGVHPEFRGRGIGRELLAWQDARARQQLATSDKRLPAWILDYADARAPRQTRLFERAGFRIARYFVELDRDLSAPIDVLDPPQGVRFEQYSPHWSASTHAARTDSFRDHWASQPMSEEQWANFVGGETFRDDLSFVAVAPDDSGRDRVVGFVLVLVNEEDWVSQGFTSCFVALVGTVRAWRGKRIAPALLGLTLTAAAALGLEHATLDVDTENPSGALGLYTRMGFVPHNSEQCLVREL